MFEENWALVILKGTIKFLDTIKLAENDRYKFIPTEHLNRTTRAGLIDNTLGRIKNGESVGAPIIRFNNPIPIGKGGSKLPHISIDETGLRNAKHPHIAVPASLIACADKLDKCLKTVGKALNIVALVTDGQQICAAIYEDMNSDENHVLPHKTITTIASIAGGWIGGAAGATAGAIKGAKIGSCIGSLFGGVGALIGAPIGAALGSIAGGIAGGLLGSYLAEHGAQKCLDYVDSESNPTFVKGFFKGLGSGAVIGAPFGPAGVIGAGLVGALCGAIYGDVRNLSAKARKANFR